jgi:hypothetical protein
MLYLLDANLLITAHRAYYPIDRVPEFWAWLQHQGASGNVRIPLEIIEEITAGRKENDELLDWIKDPVNEKALRLEEDADPALVRMVVREGYADDLTDDEVESLGRDPFLIAYAMADAAGRCVVTTENSRPRAQRQNRRIPDVCRTLGVHCCDPFSMNRALGFSTAWRR